MTSSPNQPQSQNILFYSKQQLKSVCPRNEVCICGWFKHSKMNVERDSVLELKEP